PTRPHPLFPTRRSSDLHRLEQLAIQADIRFEPASSTILLNGEDVTEAIRAPEVAEAASKVSAVPAVRRVLVDKQRELAAGSSVVDRKSTRLNSSHDQTS